MHVTDADRLTAWLTEQVCERERRPDRVREALLRHCMDERLEPPTAGRVDRIVRAALHASELALCARVVAALTPAARQRIDALVAASADEGDADDPEEQSVFAVIKQAPGSVSLESMLREIDRLRAVQTAGVGADVFDGVAPGEVAGWRALATVAAPSHLRSHPADLRVTLLAALLRERERETIDTLVDLLIATVHRVGAHAETRVSRELVNAFKRVTGKENLLFPMAEASLAAPDESVRDVVFPAVTGGEQTLRDLVQEYRTSGPIYRRTVQTTLRGLLYEPLPARPDPPARSPGVQERR